MTDEELNQLAITDARTAHARLSIGPSHDIGLMQLATHHHRKRSNFFTQNSKRARLLLQFDKPLFHLFAAQSLAMQPNQFGYKIAAFHAGPPVTVLGPTTVGRIEDRAFPPPFEEINPW